METTIHYNILKLDCELDVDIYMLNSRIFTTADLTIFSNSHDEVGKGNYLVIGIEQEIAEYESLFDVIPYTRPRFLILLGICSFFTQKLFTPFDVFTSLTKTTEIQEHECRKFTFNDKDLLPEIKKLVEFLNKSGINEIRLFYSLIDRWRKALFLELESQETGTHDDEVLLSYFHILELLSTNYYREQKTEIENQIDEFTKEILEKSLFVDKNNFQNLFPLKKRLIKENLISDIPVISKISYMLNKQGLLTEKTRNFVSTLVNDRNSVAHGRQVYQEKVVFPVPPFFPLIRNRFYSFEDLRILTGRVICCFVCIEHLEEEWSEIEKSLEVSIEQIRNFLNDKSYENLSSDSFFSGVADGVTPSAITNYLLNKKIRPEDVLPAFSELIMNYEYSEDTVIGIIGAIIIFLDIANNELKKKCIEIIMSATSDFRMRDFLNELEYFGFEPKMFKQMIIERQIK